MPVSSNASWQSTSSICSSVGRYFRYLKSRFYRHDSTDWCLVIFILPCLFINFSFPCASMSRIWRIVSCLVLNFNTLLWSLRPLDDGCIFPPQKDFLRLVFLPLFLALLGADCCGLLVVKGGYLVSTILYLPHPAWISFQHLNSNMSSKRSSLICFLHHQVQMAWNATCCDCFGDRSPFYYSFVYG